MATVDRPPREVLRPGGGAVGANPKNLALTAAAAASIAQAGLGAGETLRCGVRLLGSLTVAGPVVTTWSRERAAGPLAS